MINEEIEKAFYCLYGINQNEIWRYKDAETYKIKFMEGAKWMKDKMLENASNGFKEYLKSLKDNHICQNLDCMCIETIPNQNQAWQAAKLSSEKELSELREENKRLKHELGLGVELIKDAEASYREAVKDLDQTTQQIIQGLYINPFDGKIYGKDEAIKIRKKHGLE